MISSLARLFVIVFLIIPIGIVIFMSVYRSETGTTSLAPDARQTAISSMELQDLSWKTTGLDLVLMVDATLVNKGSRDVKDIQLHCVQLSNSGTRLGSNTKTVYEALPAGESKPVKDFNMGLIHSQATKVGCTVAGLTLM